MYPTWELNKQARQSSNLYFDLPFLLHKYTLWAAPILLQQSCSFHQTGSFLTSWVFEHLCVIGWPVQELHYEVWYSKLLLPVFCPLMGDMSLTKCDLLGWLMEYALQVKWLLKLNPIKISSHEPIRHSILSACS